MGLSAVDALLRTAAPEDADCVVFAGGGEPTLAGNLADAVCLARSVLGLPVAILTNSGLLPRDDVKNDLAKADTVVCKLDAFDDESFIAINRPTVPYTFTQILGALGEFRTGFAGKMVLQIALVPENRPHARRLAALARELCPDEVQLNLRAPWWSTGITDDEIRRIHGSFSGLNVHCVHTDGPSWAQVSDTGHLEKSHPNAAVMLMGVAA
ncbi:MAG: hypothetical protein ACYC1C_04715 [Chloroflexota bacterium]